MDGRGARFGVENVRPLASGAADSRDAAVDAAAGALVVAAVDRGRAEYRVSLAGTELIVIPGLTDDGQLDATMLRPMLAALTRELDD